MTKTESGPLAADPTPGELNNRTREATTTICEACEHAKKFGWWGSTVKGTHCRGCHRTWSGKAEGHCFECHIHVGSGRAWDAHFDGARHRSLGEVRGLRTESGKPRFKVIDRVSGPVIVEWSESPHSSTVIDHYLARRPFNGPRWLEEASMKAARREAAR